MTRGRILSLCALFSVLALVASKVAFEEQFDASWESRWVKSKWKDAEQGAFVHTKGKWYGDEVMAQAIQTSQDSKRYVLSHKFAKPIKTEDADEFVFQYSLKFETPIDCGGGYIKFVGKDFDPEQFGGETPLLIMFGPDICGPANRIHLILDFNGTGQLWKKSPAAMNDKLTHIYAFVLYKKTRTYAVFMDNQLLENGTIAEDWDLGIPKMIPDPNDKKPADWDDRMYLEDENDTKPADWVDEEMITDPDAKKPDDWDDKKEGEWKAPKIKNPKYKGQWSKKKIYNPKYKGVWKSKMVPNTNFPKDVFTGYVLGGLGIEIWQVHAGAIFDNFLITDSLEEAKKATELILEKQVKKEKEEKDKEDAEEKKKMEELKAKKDAEQPEQPAEHTQEAPEQKEEPKEEKKEEKEDL